MVLALGLIALGLPARANSLSGSDQDASHGPLSIRRVEAGHRGDGHRTKIDVFFDRAVRPGELEVGDFFGIELDGRGDRTGDAVILGAAGPRGWYPFQRGGMTSPEIQRIAANGFRVIVSPHSDWFSPDGGGYRFRLASYSESGPECSGGCWDFVPNRGWLIHDWTEPVIRRFLVPDIVLPQPEQTLIPLSWRLSDRGRSGQPVWTLWKRIMGDDNWMKVRSGVSATFNEMQLAAAEGDAFELKLTARDGVGNRARWKLRDTRVPVDDAAARYDATFSGLWEERPTEGAAFGSVHSSRTPLDTFSFSGSGTRFCISYLVADDFGIGRLILDTGEEHGFSQSTESDPGYACVESEGSAPRTATVSIDYGIVNIDGFWIE